MRRTNWLSILLMLVFTGALAVPADAQANACEAELSSDASSADYLQRAQACFATVGRLARIEPEVGLRLALNSVEQALALDPANVAAYILRGRIRTGTGARGQAIADFTVALVLSPDESDAYLGRALAMQAVGDAAGALADYDAAVALSPQESDALFYRGLFHYRNETWEAALADFEQMLTIDPDSADAYEYIGHVHYALDEPDAALAAYEHHLEIAANPSPLVNARVLLLREALAGD